MKNRSFILGLIGISMLIVYGFSQIFIKQEPGTEETFFVKKEFLVFFRLFEELGYKIETLNVLDETLDTSKVLLMFNYSEKDRKLLDKIEEWVDSGGTLFIIGVQRDIENVYDLPLRNGEIPELTLHEDVAEDVDSLQLKESNYLETDNYSGSLSEYRRLIYFDKGSVFIKKLIGSGAVYLFPDTTFLEYGNIKKRDVAVMLNNIFREYYDRDIYLLNKTEQTKTLASPLVVFFTDKFLLTTVHLIVVLLVFALYSSIRFGEADLLNPFKHRSIAEHIEAVAVFYKKCGKRKVVEDINREFFTYNIDKKISKVTSDLKNEIDSMRKPVIDNDTLNDEYLFKNEEKRFKIIRNLKDR